MKYIIRNIVNESINGKMTLKKIYFGSGVDKNQTDLFSNNLKSFEQKIADKIADFGNFSAILVDSSDELKIEGTYNISFESSIKIDLKIGSKIFVKDVVGDVKKTSASKYSKEYLLSPVRDYIKNLK